MLGVMVVFSGYILLLREFLFCKFNNFTFGMVSNTSLAYIMMLMVCAKLLQLCSTVCDPMDCSPSGSSVHGILQTGTLEWIAMPSSRGSS